MSKPYSRKQQILQFIASVTLLIGSMINLIKCFVDIPFWLFMISGICVSISAILYIVVLVCIFENKKK